MPAAAEKKKAVLHSLFSLEDGVSPEDFAAALEAFFEHLRQQGFACSLRLMRRQPLPGFGAKLPQFDYYAAIEFHDLASDQAAYDYVAGNLDPVRSLHAAMNSKVRRGSAHFFLSADV